MRQQRFPADMSTRRMRENIDPETGNPGTGAASPYRAIGTDAQATLAYRSIGGSGGSVSLKDSRVGGLFAKNSIKGNWRADGGLNTPLGRSARDIGGQSEGMSWQEAGSQIKSTLGKSMAEADAEYLTGTGPSMTLIGSDEDESFANTGLDTQQAAAGGQVRSFSGQLDDYVFNGSMSDKDRMQVMRVMNRKYGARGVLS